MSNEPLLELRHASKRYPGVLALDNMDFDLRSGEVHVLFGENGAGKSTLISLIAGANQPSSGAWIDKKALRERSRALLAQLDFALDLDSTVDSLSRAQQQMVEIAKAFRSQLSILILDEPTASLTDKETEHLFTIIEKLKRSGVGIIYISHRMQEIRRISDRITVLRDGKKIATVDAKTTSEDRLIEMMAGRAITEIYPQIAANPGATILDIYNLSTPSGVRNATLSVRRGEVVGLAGLIGCGKSELLRAAFGIEPITQGSVHLKGLDVTGKKPSHMLQAGFFYLPPDRKAEGLILGFASGTNMTLSALDEKQQRGWFGELSRRAMSKLAQRTSQRVELAEQNIDKPVGQLSGGNQQKVLFAKGLVRGTDLYVFDEPTVGVDVGTRSALYLLIKQLCESGAAVIVISSDLPEVLHLSHRLYVMQQGRIAAELRGDAINEANVLRHFFEREEQAA
jgi:ribose transport system ATP-binding protein